MANEDVQKTLARAYHENTGSKARLEEAQRVATSAMGMDLEIDVVVCRTRPYSIFGRTSSGTSYGLATSTRNGPLKIASRSNRGVSRRDPMLD